ncbi:MAG: hypothetical protein WCJ82_04635 [Actinomycetota bacterium]
MSETPRDPDDLVGRLLGGLDDVLDQIHDRLLRPIIMVVRALSYGVVFVTLAVILLICVTIGLVRLLDVYAFAQHPWASDLVLGGLFVLVGLVIWRRRRPPTSRK